MNKIKFIQFLYNLFGAILIAIIATLYGMQKDAVIILTVISFIYFDLLSTWRLSRYG